MSSLTGKRILIGVGGGIAAYKSAELARALQRAGAEVRAVLTEGGSQFITPLTLQALTGERVGTSLFDAGAEYEIGHIELARWADVVVVAPATADLIARMRAGMANDLLTTVLLATTAEVLVCPAMNTQMYLHPATAENLSALAGRRRHTVLDPDRGVLACGEEGAGRLPDANVIVAWVERLAHSRPLQGRHVVVTAGPTREHFDPVRFLSNPSSGKMGYAVAAAAFAAGADVTLISGPVALAAPPGVTVVPVETAAQMHEAVFEAVADILVMAAAVADYKPAELHAHKLKKSDEDWMLRMERTVDILAALANDPRRPRTVVGFAAETDEPAERGREKMRRKKLDGIVTNSVATISSAFGSDTNTVTLIGADGIEQIVGPAPKREVADAIVAWLPALEARLGR
jgi:phosphopantothenoylcysteine decarboxylase/phosphopantothenate--cysteine ligase